jgi:type VI protein secretion system component VasF
MQVLRTIINRCMKIGNHKTKVDSSMLEVTEKMSMDPFRPVTCLAVAPETKAVSYKEIIIAVAWLTAMKFTAKIMLTTRSLNSMKKLLATRISDVDQECRQQQATEEVAVKIS